MCLFQEFRRFLHFYERHSQHSRSKQVAARLIAEADTRVRAYLQHRAKHPTSRFTPNFYAEAAQLVFEVI